MATQNHQHNFNPRLHRYAVLLVIATFVLVASGGNVTSRDAGLAVPDGFTVYGHFLWTFPLEMWRGNIFHEHIHRLKGSAIGLMAIGLAVWMWVAHGRAGVKNWRRWLGVAALVMVILQGVMGGLRVEFARWFPALEVPFRVGHAVTGQLFLCLTVVIAVVTSRIWHERVDVPERRDLNAVSPAARVACFVLMGVLMLQLLLGATMRHTRSGMAIPDFPASYGAIVPPLTQRGIVAATDQQVEYNSTSSLGYYTPAQVGIAYAHRVWALAVVLAACVVLGLVGPIARADAAIRAPLLLIMVLLILQVALGAATVWSKLYPDVATAHQAIGAGILAAAVWMTLRLHMVRLYPDTPDGTTDWAKPSTMAGLREAVA